MGDVIDDFGDSVADAFGGIGDAFNSFMDPVFDYGSNIMNSSAGPLAIASAMFGGFTPGGFGGMFGGVGPEGGFGAFDPGGQLFGMGGGSSGGLFGVDVPFANLMPGEWDWMGGMGGGSGGPLGTVSGGGFGGLGGQLLKGGLNFLTNTYQQRQANKAAERMMYMGNPLNDPRRSDYQNMSRDLLMNPQGYLQNNPFATQLSAHYKNNVIPAEVSTTGNTNLVLDRAGSQFAQAIAGNYNELANVLMGYGGFNQPMQGLNSAGQLQQIGLRNQAEAFRGFGDVAERVFGTPGSPKQNAQNPVTGSTTTYQ